MSWDSFPTELRLMVFQALVDDDCNLAACASVCREWQRIMEPHTFARIKLTPQRIKELDTMTRRSRHHVRYLWVCMDVDPYNCISSPFFTWRMETRNDREGARIKTAFHDLFSALSTWDPDCSLTLDISLCSPSDVVYGLQYPTFEPDVPPKTSSHDDSAEQTVPSREDSLATDEGSQKRQRVEHDDYDGMSAAVRYLYLGWWAFVPLVPAVKCLLLRQQTRRLWKPSSLSDIISRLPRLRELHYEPWRQSEVVERRADGDFFFLLMGPALRRLRRLTIFENFNEQYAPSIARDRAHGIPDQLITQWILVQAFKHIRAPNSALGKALARASHGFESLSASYMVDASDFFSAAAEHPRDQWPNLKYLALTSQLLAPDQSRESSTDMLEKAAAAVGLMPRLETLDIWNGSKELAALFRCKIVGRDQPSIITWRSTWHFILEPSVMKAWEDVTTKRAGKGVMVVYEGLDGDGIAAYGDAIHMLELPEVVVRPVSLKQIRRQQKYTR